jgi:BT4734-like, N-terminal domain/Primase C terminal 2 (PriCT-2)
MKKMSVLSKKVSCFSSYRDVIPKEVKLIDFLTSKKYADNVDKIRHAKTKDEIDMLKSKLPAITPSGLFHTRRAAENLVSHTGLIQIDIDGKDNKHLNISKTKELLKEIQQVCYCAFSVSGKGLFALVQISTPEKHKEHFLALERDFKEDFNIIIDKSCKDVSRLRGYSYDPEYYVNDNALIYEKLFKVKSKTLPVINKVYSEPLNEVDTFYKALKIIENNHLDITGSNEQWFSILCSIANEFGEGGRGFAHLVSQYSTLYENNRCDKDFSRALKTNYSYGLGTFYHYLKQYLI